jgi:hypothetical protein
MRLVFLTVLVTLACSPLQALDFDLRFDRLAAALALIGDSDKGAVEEAVQFIRRGENQLALARLSALNKANPNNSSLRILTAYALLKVGNLAGAFEEARSAEGAPNGNSYKCWFLAKVAFLAGNKDVCRRELKHVKGVGDMPNEAAALERQLKK